jgi:hypothetical protein
VAWFLHTPAAVGDAAAASRGLCLLAWMQCALVVRRPVTTALTSRPVVVCGSAASMQQDLSRGKLGGMDIRDLGVVEGGGPVLSQGVCAVCAGVHPPCSLFHRGGWLSGPWAGSHDVFVCVGAERDGGKGTSQRAPAAQGMVPVCYRPDHVPGTRLAPQAWWLHPPVITSMEVPLPLPFVAGTV